MANVRQLKDHGAPIFPITHVSLVKGMEYRALMDATYAWDGTGAPDVSKIPAGVVVTYNGTDYTGTLVASASTTGRFYLVPSTTVQGEWDRYMTDGTGSSYAWKAAGNTSIPSPAVVDNETTDDPTKPHSAAGGKRLKDQLGELEAKVDDFDKEISIDLTEDQDDDIEVETNAGDYVAHIDGDGVHSKDYFIQATKTGTRKSITDELAKLEDVEKGGYYGDEEIIITDDNNVVKFGVGADGPFTEGRKPLLPFDKRADRTYKEGASTDTPLASIKESMGLLPMFENWGFIGDSLSSGFINVPNVGGVSPLVDTTETIGRNIYPISWGQLICKMCGSKGANYSVGGATTRSWLSYFGGMTPANVGYSDGAKGADFSVKRDVYTIMLATNDAGQGNIPVGDISTDVDLQDYHNNADTYAGNYARIISMIKELVHSAKVFCIIPYKSWSVNAEQGGYNDVVRQLVTMFDKTYLVDLYTYGGNLDSDYLYASHSTTQGCIYTAYVIANYIDYIIRKNPQDFIFQGCVSRLANDNGNY